MEVVLAAHCLVLTVCLRAAVVGSNAIVFVLYNI